MVSSATDVFSELGDIPVFNNVRSDLRQFGPTGLKRTKAAYMRQDLTGIGSPASSCSSAVPFALYNGLLKGWRCNDWFLVLMM